MQITSGASAGFWYYDGQATALTTTTCLDFGAGGGLAAGVGGSANAFDEEDFAEGSLIIIPPGTVGNGRGCCIVAVSPPTFVTPPLPPHSSTTTEGSNGAGFDVEEEECSNVVGDLDHAPISNRVRLGPSRTGEGEVLRGNDDSRGRFDEEESWNWSSYSCCDSGSNEEPGKENPGVVGGVVVLLSASSGLLVVVVVDFLLPLSLLLLLLAPKRPRSRGLLISVDLMSSPTYTSEWRDGSGNPETERAIHPLV